MSKYSNLLFSALLALLTTSCYHELDLDDFKNNEGKNLLTLNSLICPDSVIAVSATRPYFFSDKHNERTYIKGLNILLSINGQECETLTYNESRHLYLSTIKPKQGDIVKVSTVFNDKLVEAYDTIPYRVSLLDIDVKRRGPLAIYTDRDFVFTYSITFDDPTNETNYYFLQWNEVDAQRDVMMGERDFTHELVFQALANDIHETLPGWKPYCAYGLPFSDRGINGQRHTLVLEETVQADRYSGGWRKPEMKRNFKLYAISKQYYQYLVSVLVNQTDDRGLQGGMIDLGIADPIKIYSNISGGIGILAGYTISQKTINVFDSVGEIPRQ